MQSVVKLQECLNLKKYVTLNSPFRKKDTERRLSDIGKNINAI
jgi:hypothetical protein